jgi:hypothetical protein
MRRLTHGRMEQGRRGALGALGQRLLFTLAAAPGLGLSVACSADPVAIPIPDGPDDNGGTVLEPGDPRVGQCGTDGIVCGEEGCCTAGNICSDFGRCIPAAACTNSEDCSADSQCAAGRCLPWDNFPEGRRSNQSCRTAVDLPSVIPEVQCQWPGAALPTVEPTFTQVIGTPMVVDFDSDANPTTIQPSIVFVSYDGPYEENTGVIRVIDGKTCELQDTIEGEFAFTPRVPVALGDFNGDGRPDIVAADEEPVGAAVSSGIAFFELTGTGPTPKFRPMPKGRIRSSSTGTITGFAMHDVDNDDLPELFTEKTMLRFDQQQGLVNASALQQANRPELTTIEPPTVIDIDGDRFPELITPQGVFTWDTQLRQIVDKYRVANVALWNTNPDDIEGAFMASANLADNWPTGLPQGKDSAELVIIGHDGSVRVKTVDGSARFSMTTAGLAGGPPVIADIDGDGRMEFASGGRNKMTVFDLDCTPAFFNQAGCGGGRGEQNANGVLWEASTRGSRSGVAMFDFNGDGKTEVVYADQCFMRVYDGMSGNVLFSTPRSSITQWEYPVVADTDGDRNSEIVTVSNDNQSVTCDDTDLQNLNAQVEFKPTHGVTVWKEATDRWAGSRPVWNQHNYFVTNVRDDGTIPKMTEVQPHWTAGGPNTFRQNVQGETGKSLTLADVTTAGASTFTCRPAENLATVQVDLCNRGGRALRANETQIALRNAAEPTRLLCQERNEQAIEPGRCVQVTCDIPVIPQSPPFDLEILGDALTEVDECYESNNVSIIARVACDPVLVPR